ncbi:sensor histidine kinase [Hydrogenophilus thiooxidans]|uniref:sensor histidine kinase n=1 Tax=Hydrogenophilus thiooxidans TaxID=2820326 RepID=UPI001C23750A|nr:HAMP domain-containing sensor histidine kinase [Hydrogenophilus thiooxidans]
MKPLTNLSLRWKIPLRVMFAVLGTAFLITTALLVKDYEEMRANLERNARSLGSLLANTLISPVLHDDVWRAFEILRSVRIEEVPAMSDAASPLLLVIDKERRIFVANEPRRYPLGALVDELRGDVGQMAKQVKWEGNAQQQSITVPESNTLFVISPLVTDGEALGHVVLGYATTAILPHYRELVLRAFWITCLAMLFILPVSWIWARRTAEPLLALASAMRHVPDRLTEAEQAALPESGDEIGQLSAAFRRMIAELKLKQELEEQMVVSERLAAIGRLTAGIAHEINNPLGGMLTAVKTWQKHGEHDPIAAQTVSLLERGLTQIRNTVAALLVETKLQDRSLEPADLEDIYLLVEGEVHARHVTLQIDSNLSAPLPLPATPIRQILLNLILNAIAASPPNGIIAVAVQCTESRHLLLSVCNDGDPIPENQMAYLFEPFATQRKEGHGLGLWVVYQLVKQLNGGLSVESHSGRTCFLVEIPYALPD